MLAKRRDLVKSRRSASIVCFPGNCSVLAVVSGTLNSGAPVLFLRKAEFSTSAYSYRRSSACRLWKISSTSSSVIVTEWRVDVPSLSSFSYNRVRSRKGLLVSSLRSLNVIFDLKMMTPTPMLAGNIVPPEKLKDAANASAGSRFGGLNPYVADGVL